MENVVLVIHLMLALALIAIVLLQRSEGGGLGMGGGGGGGGGAMSARGAATAMGRITWFLAIGFIVTSISLTILSARTAANSSVIGDGIQTTAPAGNLTVPEGAFTTPDVEGLMPPAAADSPLTPPRAD